MFRDCVDFYRSAFGKFPKMRRKVEKEVRKDLSIESDEDKEKFEKFINSYPF